MDELIDIEDGTLASLCQRLKKKGAENIYLCASHGIFTMRSHDFFDVSTIKNIVVTDTIPCDGRSRKVIQMSVAPQIAKVIEAEFLRDSSDELRGEDDGTK